MIFVTVATHEQQFNRLLKEVDELIEQGVIKEKVIMQIGYSDYVPKHAVWFRFKDSKDIRKIMHEARIIISHGGSGTLLEAVSLGKAVIGVPRLKKFEEHFNDHQIQIVRELEKEKRIIAVYDIKMLAEAIRKAGKMKIKRKEEKIIMAPIIKQFLENLK